jgi:hypothetical protein
MLGAIDVAARLALISADIPSLSASHYPVRLGCSLFPLNSPLLPLQPDGLSCGQLAGPHALTDPVLLILLTIPDARCARLRESGSGHDEYEADCG